MKPMISWFSSFVYFNVYAQPYTDEWSVRPVTDVVWIGTSAPQAPPFDVPVGLEGPFF